MSAQLQATGVDFSFEPRTILADITLTLAPGDRLGVVGPNGTGKTTLLRLLAAQLTPGRGTIVRNPGDATVGLMSQQLQDRPGETVDTYLSRVTGTQAAQEEFDAAIAGLAEPDGHAEHDRAAAERYDHALERYLRTAVATFDERVETTLRSVRLDPAIAAAETGRLSGGQRTRVNLAGMLLATVDVLLLDEPTNDLDGQGLELLEAMLLGADRPTALVSHDRAFLERIVTAVFELDDHSNTGTRFNGGFAAWERDRRTAQLQHQQAFQEYTAKRAGLQEQIDTQQRWATRGARRAKNDRSEGDKFIRAHRIATSEKVAGKAKRTERALERLDRNERVDAPWEPWELRLDFAAAPRSGSTVAELTGAMVIRNDFRLGPITAEVGYGDRILITGSNGSGKTTLLQALLGRIELTAGSSRLGPSVVSAVLSQQRTLFEESPTLLAGFSDAVGCDDPTARSQLAKLGLDSDRIARPIAELSPGEQTRAALGLFAARGSNLLVLDEPTNHLDLPAIEQLEAALDVFPHTVLLVTHDRRLIETVSTTRHWEMVDGQLRQD